MLSYNTDKYNEIILKRIKESLFSKKALQTNAKEKDCQLTTPAEIINISNILQDHHKDRDLATQHLLLNPRVSLGLHGRDINGYGATGELIKAYRAIKEGKLLDKTIPAQEKAVSGLSNFHKRFEGTLGEGTKRFGTVVGGIDIAWAEEIMRMFGTTQKNSALNTLSGVFSTDRWNGTRMVMKDTAMAIHPYHKRERQIVEGGKLHQGWEGIIGDGYSGLRTKHYEELNAILSDPTHEHHGVIKLNDLYNEDGSLKWQVPKNVIESLHNLDGLDIQTAQNILRESHYDKDDSFNLGHLYSNDEEKRKKAMEQVREKISGMGSDKAQLAIFQHMLEARETPRTWNNMMQVVMHGQENMHKYLRNMYGAVAMNQLNEDEHGATIVLSDGEQISRSGLIKEMAKMQVSYQIGRDVYGREPTIKEVKQIRSQGIQDPVTKEHITVGKDPNETSSIPGVSADIQGLMSDAVNYESMEGQGRRFENLGTNSTENEQRMKFLADAFDMGGYLNTDGTSSGTVVEFMQDEKIDKKVKDMFTKSKEDYRQDDPEIQSQIKAVKKYLHQVAQAHSVRVNANGSKRRVVDGKVIQGKPEKSQSEKLARTKSLNNVLDVLQRPDELVSTDKYSRIERAERNKLWKSFNSDGSWSADELEGANAGHFNRVLDLFTSVQVNRLEYGDHASKGGGAWGFQDHHIFGKGDNQANTHFALAFTPLHQAGLHTTNYMIENYDTVQENLRMQHEILKHYESQVDRDPEFEIEQSQVDQIRELIDSDGNINEELLKSYYDTDELGKTHLRPGSTIPALTLYGTEVGYAPSSTILGVDGNILNQTGNGREHLEMQEHHGVHLIPPMRKSVVEVGGHYENSTSHSFEEGTELDSLSGWSNASGSILRETRTLTLDQINGDMFASMSIADREKLKSMINKETGTVDIPYHSEFYFIEMNDKAGSQMGKPSGSK
jgi:hypothetical protein